MNFAIPNDPQELEWLTDTAISAHCDVSAGGEFSTGFGGGYTSTVSLLLSETRSAKTLRYSGRLLPLLGALSALDQYGTCYEPIPPSFPPAFANKSGVIKSAHNFLNIPVNSPDSDALYALRNALMHQSSLISVGQQAIPKHFWFEIDNTSPNLFTHATAPWNGIYNTRSDGNKTVVNAEKLGGLAFNLVETLKAMQLKKKLKLVLPNGLVELLTTYVDIRFEKDFRVSYLRYLGEMISRSLNSPPAAAQQAQAVLDKLSTPVLHEAVVALANTPGCPSFDQLHGAYPQAALKPY